MDLTEQLNQLKASPIMDEYKIVDLAIEINGEETKLSERPELCLELGIDHNNIGKVEDGVIGWAPTVKSDVSLVACWHEELEEWF